MDNTGDDEDRKSDRNDGPIAANILDASALITIFWQFTYADRYESVSLFL